MPKFRTAPTPKPRFAAVPDAAAAFAAWDEAERRRADEVERAVECARVQQASMTPEPPFNALARRIAELETRLAKSEARVAELETDTAACIDVKLAREKRSENGR